jgi:hypothetical protein
MGRFLDISPGERHGYEQKRTDTHDGDNSHISRSCAGTLSKGDIV